MGYNLTDVVKNLILINVVFFLGTELLMCPGCLIPYEKHVLWLFFPLSEYFMPLQLATHLFMHAGPMHLIFNMFALFFFGPRLEYLWGPKRFLLFYLICGFGATLLSILHDYYLFQQGGMVVPSLGASGAIFGVLIGFAILFPDEKGSLLFIPIEIKMRYIAIGFIAFDLLGGFGPLKTGIGHFAHLGGALTGAILVWYWRSRGRGYM